VRRLSLDQGNAQARIAQRHSQTGASQATSDDNQIKLLHDRTLDDSRE
jgi:hypothetical protein